jgi:hypothetical protein
MTGTPTMRLAGSLACLAIACASAIGQPAAVDPRTVGPQVGSRVPAFTLPDQGGQSRTLPSLLGPKGAILVFFRSADW